MHGKLLLLCALCTAALGCEREQRAQIQVEVGRDDAERTTFTPLAGFAEYVELPGLHHELTITLASYRASCSEFVPPTSGQTLVTVVVTTPSELPPKPGTFPWSGPTSREPRALPTVRLGERGYELVPGGTLELAQVDLSPQGLVEGRLAFEFAGDGERPAQRVSGRFSVRICRFRRAREP